MTRAGRPGEADAAPGAGTGDTAGRPARDRDAAGRPRNSRPRDVAGRPRNSRPRDALGRPLRHDASGVPQLPDQPALPPDAALGLAQQLIDSGRAFSAHEVLEASWKAAPPAERALWQGLAQVAVGLTHAQRGNARGAAALLRRGSQQVAAAYSESPPHGIDAAQVARRAAGLASLIERDGLTAATPDALRLTLRAPPNA